ncbi:hypothetical protein [Haliangium ochraceum]|uniref:hypothetical protein n=1 Tax=Haliangium ochraceum TaxID=80816 RepID=UPI00019B9F77|nr:hypothetical protein [Haliangium ochraceum]
MQSILRPDPCIAGSALAARAPRDWTLQGRDPAADEWVTVDSRSEQVFWNGVETRSFEVAEPGSFARYRLHVTRDNDARAPIVAVSIDDLELIEACQP